MTLTLVNVCLSQQIIIKKAPSYKKGLSKTT
jgi:hypothetical protein